MRFRTKRTHFKLLAIHVPQAPHKDLVLLRQSCLLSKAVRPLRATRVNVIMVEEEIVKN